VCISEIIFLDEIGAGTRTRGNGAEMGETLGYNRADMWGSESVPEWSQGMFRAVPCMTTDNFLHFLESALI
jgi:hypothetical protein